MDKISRYFKPLYSVVLAEAVFPLVFLQQHYKKMVQLVSEKRDLYRDKLQLLLQSVTTVPTDDDTVQQEVEEDGDSPCDDTPGNDEDEQIEHFLYDDDGKCSISNLRIALFTKNLAIFENKLL